MTFHCEEGKSARLNHRETGTQELRTEEGRRQIWQSTVGAWDSLVAGQEWTGQNPIWNSIIFRFWVCWMKPAWSQWGMYKHAQEQIIGFAPIQARSLLEGLQDVKGIPYTTIISCCDVHSLSCKIHQQKYASEFSICNAIRRGILASDIPQDLQTVFVNKTQ